MKLAVHYCLRHPDRHAAARCMVCSHRFCRECVTEHSGRYMCADCLRKEVGKRERGKSGLLRATGQWSLAVLAVCVTWALFFEFASGLLDAADYFHPEPFQQFDK